MTEFIKLAKHLRLRNNPGKTTAKRTRLGATAKGHKWSPFLTQTISMPLVADLLRDVAPPRSPDANAILESGVLAFHREHNGEPMVLLISKRRSKKWGIPKGRAEPHLSLHENAAKEVFEEAGVIGYIAPTSAGMFRVAKTTANPWRKRVIEVWDYLLEVTETLPDWPEGRNARSAGSHARPLRRSFVSRFWPAFATASRRTWARPDRRLSRFRLDIDDGWRMRRLIGMWPTHTRKSG